MFQKIIVLCVVFMFCSCSNKSIFEKDHFKKETTLSKVIAYKIDVVRVLNKSGNITSYGTGFFVEHDEIKYFVTASHLFDDLPDCITEIRNNDNNIIEVELIKVKDLKYNDLMIFKIGKFNEEKNVLFRKIRSSKNKMIAKGYKDGKLFTESLGYIRKSVLDVSNEIFDGMSGGPVLDEEGYVVGVISARFVHQNGGIVVGLENVFDNLLYLE